jgi:ubiquinone/menaquinone biosynthesis C-methylase UbiE
MFKRVIYILRAFVLGIIVYLLTCDNPLSAPVSGKYTLRQQSAALNIATRISNTLEESGTHGPVYDGIPLAGNIQDVSNKHVSYDLLKESVWYRHVNDSLAYITGVQPGENILEIGSGTGASTAVLLDKIGSEGNITALEPNEAYLNIAQKTFKNRPVEFILAGAEEIDEVMKNKPPVDSAFIFNAIHLINGHGGLFSSLSRVIAHGGILAFNTVYFQDSNSDFKKRQKHMLIKMLRYAKEKGKDIKTKSRPKITVCSIMDYETALISAGFEVISITREKVRISLSDIENFYRDDTATDYILPLLTSEEREQIITKIVRDEIKQVRAQGRDYIEGEWLFVTARNTNPALSRIGFGNSPDEISILKKNHAFAISGAA